MKSSKQNHTEQLNLFFEPTVLPNKPSIAIMTLPENTQQRRLNHMAKFKPFHEFQNPLIGFTPESFPHLHEDKFRLCGNGTTQRPSLQISERSCIFIRHRTHRNQVFLFRSTYVSSEVPVKFIVLWICNRSSQQ